MKHYVVGGAVRDMLMGVEPKDIDYVVVGATPEDMIARGFTQRGKDFPVFVDAEENEWALARVDRKVAPGYNGFVSTFDTSVTLEDDLGRRDLTINAIAYDPVAGTYIDPYRGGQDIEKKVIRHLNLDDDPLRVLRIARFLARFGDGWVVAEETKDYVRGMRTELRYLQPDRVRKELLKAFETPQPRKFFDFLKDVGVIDAVFPEIAALVECKENPVYHPEGNSFEHTMLVLQACKALGGDAIDMVAALCHDMGKPLVEPVEGRTGHFPAHDTLGKKPTRAFAERFGFPSELLVFLTSQHMKMHVIREMRPAKITKLFDDAKARTNPNTIIRLCLLGEADNRGRAGSENAEMAGLADYLVPIMAAYNSVRMTEDDIKKIDKFKNNREKLMEFTFRKRVAAVAEAMKKV